MLPLFTPETMYALEKRWFDAGNPSLALMKRAAKEVLASLEEHFGEIAGRTVHVACGSGNNAGDGYAFSLLAAEKGAHVTLVWVKSPDSLKGDALICAKEALSAGLPCLAFEEAADLPRPDLWIDALFGIGLNRPLEGDFARFIEQINKDHENGSRVIAVDAPSGLNLTTGRVMGCCVQADLTVTFHCAKIGHFMNDGLDLCGLVDVRDIGITLEADAPVKLIEKSDAFSALPKRKRNIHKGSCGHVLIVAGSMGMCGAARYAAQMALRSGAGLVTLACPRSIVPILQTLMPGAMAIGLPENDGVLTAEGTDRLIQAMKGKSAVIVGPGLSQRAAPEIVRAVLESGLPAIVDADALNLIAANEDMKALLRPYHVLTPHPGEAARLLGGLTDPISDVKRLHELGATALLKGAATLICGKSGLFLSASGCGGMAVGGSGDVLAGLLGGLLAQKVDPETAAWAASELHGLCGEAAADALTETAMTAEDLIAYWPKILK